MEQNIFLKLVVTMICSLKLQSHISTCGYVLIGQHRNLLIEAKIFLTSQVCL